MLWPDCYGTVAEDSRVLQPSTAHGKTLQATQRHSVRWVQQDTLIQRGLPSRIAPGMHLEAAQRGQGRRIPRIESDRPLDRGRTRERGSLGGQQPARDGVRDRRRDVSLDGKDIVGRAIELAAPYADTCGSADQLHRNAHAITCPADGSSDQVGDPEGAAYHHRVQTRGVTIPTHLEA